MLALRWQNLFDFFALTVAMYLLLRWGREARAFRVCLAIVGLKAGALLARQLDLIITSLLLDVLSWLVPRRSVTLQPEWNAISSAAFSLATAQCGALIVITRRDSVDDLIDGGVRLGGDISPEILEAIFRKKSPVHDGATIIHR